MATEYLRIVIIFYFVKDLRPEVSENAPCPGTHFYGISLDKNLDYELVTTNFIQLLYIQLGCHGHRWQ